MRALRQIPAEKNVILGSFTVESGQIRVSDPCYCPTEREGYGKSLKHGEGILILPALNGRWQLMARMVVDGMFGRRCMALMAFHESMFMYSAPGKRVGKKLFVDSGQMMVCDEAHFPRDVESFEYTDSDKDPSFYRQLCNLTYDPDSGEPLFGGCLQHACVTSSGYGDGSYPAFVYSDPTGLAVSVTVDFGDEEDEDEYDDDDDDWDEEDDGGEDDDDEDEPDEDDDA